MTQKNQKQYQQYLITGIIKPISFSRKELNEDIAQWQRKCGLENCRKRYQQNRDKRIKQSKKYYYKNKSKISDINHTKYEENKLKISSRNKKYRENNRQQILAKKQVYRQINKENIKVKSRKYYQDNKSKILDKKTEKLKTDPVFKLTHNIRTNINRSYRKFITYKQMKTNRILGCSFKQFIKYIQSQFRNGMTLENHGTVWQFDHIIPIAYAACLFIDVQKQKQMITKLNHYTNFQPLFINENLQKGKKII